MMDAEDFDFVCPHRICHKRHTADAHTIINLKGEIQRLTNAPTCKACNGSGSGMAMTRHLGPDDYEEEVTCPYCNGTGSSPV